MSAVHPGAGADLDDVVCAPDGLHVVFDHDHSVSDVTEFFHGLDHPDGVARVQPDARLVHHVQHAHELAADLGGHLDPLHFAARDTVTAPSQADVVQTDVDEQPQARRELPDDGLGHLPLVLIEPQPLEELEQLRELHPTELVNVQSAHLDVEPLLLEPRPAALRADLLDHAIPDELGFERLGSRGAPDIMPVPALHFGRKPDERTRPAGDPVLLCRVWRVKHLDWFALGSEKQDLVDVLRQVPERSVQTKPVLLREAVHLHAPVALHARGRGVENRALERSARDAPLRRDHKEARLHHVRQSHPHAGVAGARRSVEGKMERLHLEQRVVVFGAPEPVIEARRRAGRDLDLEKNVLVQREHRGLDGLGELDETVVPEGEPVDKQLDPVLARLVQLALLRERERLPVHDQVLEPLLAQQMECVLVVLAVRARKRGAQLDDRARRELPDALRELGGGPLTQRVPAHRAGAGPYRRKQEA